MELTQLQLQVVQKIRAFGADYDSDCSLTLEDQLLACEAVYESTPVIGHYIKTNYSTSELVFSGNDSVSGACYSEVNKQLFDNYLTAIEHLKSLTSLSAPNLISPIFENLFGEPLKVGHWLWVSQNYNPRQIIWVLLDIYKSLSRGSLTIRTTPAAYFTFLIKRRAKRSFDKRKIRRGQNDDK